MSDETKVETTEAPAGMAALETLTESPVAEVAAAPVEPSTILAVPTPLVAVRTPPPAYG